MMVITEGESYNGAGTTGIAATAPKQVRLHPKKRIAKLTRKQKVRKSKKLEKGEAIVDRAASKQARDALKQERKLRAKGLW
eukprot:CAMPEP_0119298876 /NCGR_PEP_ID=MMETSP1333-20130426/1008_1 /TAXON_ID=418940 /ORGANISM="Scyphosphaera apsteinii, Strain RCC1455" /LENGTH=80 /DNA_ID=CAMNT_0007300095 /DNA_START=221 /DNA_END=463 /DNA_ORIENTATION=+